MTESEMLRMQQEAVRRAREMQNRARRGEPPKPPPPPPPIHHESMSPSPPRMERPVERPLPPPPPNHSEGLLEVLFRDKEKTLILCLVLLLMDEKSDNSLILALLYLLI